MLLGQSQALCSSALVLGSCDMDLHVKSLMLTVNNEGHTCGKLTGSCFTALGVTSGNKNLQVKLHSNCKVMDIVTVPDPKM